MTRASGSHGATGTGYNTETQPLLFDRVYTGTETRDTDHTMQHLARYGSYSLLRWFENVKPGGNGGGWIDQCHSINNLAYYLEQAFLTYFAGARELMLFCYSWLIDTVYIPPLGHELGHLDKIMGHAGKPVGIPVCEPFHAHGEDHLYDYLGMSGIAFEPLPVFPESAPMVFLTADSAGYENILEKLKSRLESGGDACITSGFLKAMQGKGIEDITSAFHTERKVCSKYYEVSGGGWEFKGEVYGREPVMLPQVEYMNNSSNCLISMRREDNNFPVLLSSQYGAGTLYILVVPDDYADLYKYPAEVLTGIRRYLMGNMGIYLECGEKICLFLYDNDTFIIESFLGHDTRIRVHMGGSPLKLTDVRSGEEIQAVLQHEGESVFELNLSPVFYRMLRIERG